MRTRGPNDAATRWKTGDIDGNNYWKSHNVDNLGDVDNLGNVDNLDNLDDLDTCKAGW